AQVCAGDKSAAQPSHRQAKSEWVSSFAASRQRSLPDEYIDSFISRSRERSRAIAFIASSIAATHSLLAKRWIASVARTKTVPLRNTSLEGRHPPRRQTAQPQPRRSAM